MEVRDGVPRTVGGLRGTAPCKTVLFDSLSLDSYNQKTNKQKQRPPEPPGLPSLHTSCPVTQAARDPWPRPSSFSPRKASPEARISCGCLDSGAPVHSPHLPRGLDLQGETLVPVSFQSCELEPHYSVCKGISKGLLKRLRSEISPASEHVSKPFMNIGSSMVKKKPFTYSFILSLILFTSFLPSWVNFLVSKCVVLCSCHPQISRAPGPPGSLASLRTLPDLSLCNKLDSSADGFQRQQSIFTHPASSLDLGALTPTLPTPVHALLSFQGSQLCSSSKATNQCALPESAWSNAKVNCNANSQRNVLDLQPVV